jgi:hypothetical protein
MQSKKSGRSPAPQSSNCITTDEWLRELESCASFKSDSGATVNEISAAIAHSSRWICIRLKMLDERGMLGKGFRRTVAISGRSAMTPVYWLLKK